MCVQVSFADGALTLPAVLLFDVLSLFIVQVYGDIIYHCSSTQRVMCSSTECAAVGTATDLVLFVGHSQAKMSSRDTGSGDLKALQTLSSLATQC